MTSIGSRSHELHVSGRNKGIREIDLEFALSEANGEDGDDSGIAEENALLLATVTSLDVSRNEIETLSNLGPLSALRRLDVSYNLISAVHGLPFTLTRLNISHNRLRSLDGLTHLPHLKELDVSANRLSMLVGLGPRAPLRVLRADDNRIVSTAGLEDMPSLCILSLANNYIERLDDLAFLSSAVSLQALTLKNNPVTSLSGYRSLVGQRQASLLTLDGAPLLRPRRPEDYLLQGSSTLRSSAPPAAPLAPATAARRSPPAVLGGVGSAITSVHVTPVHATAPSDIPTGEESPFFDDSLLRELGGGRRPRDGPPPRASPTAVTATPAVAAASSVGASPAHPYAGTSTNTNTSSSSSKGDAGTRASRELDTSADSEGAPVATRQPPPRPTARAPNAAKTEERAEEVQSSDTASGRRSAELSRVPRAATAKSVPRRTPSESYARQFAEAQAVKRGSTHPPTPALLSRAAPPPSAPLRSEGVPGGDSRASSVAASVAAQAGTTGHVARSVLSRSISDSRAVAAGPEERGADVTAGAEQRSTAARLHDCLVAQEQLAGENQRLRARLSKCEEQLAESRRIVSEQLGTLSRTRLERDALRQAEGDAKEQLERARRHAKALEGHHKEEVAALQLQFERTKTFYEAQLADLRRQLAAEVTRSAAYAKRSLGEVEGSASTTAPPLHAPPVLPRTHTLGASACGVRHAQPPPSASGAASSPSTAPPLANGWLAAVPAASHELEIDSPTSPAPPPVDSRALAAQLKGWLFHEMAEDLDAVQQEVLHQQLQASLAADEKASEHVAPPPDPDRARAILEDYILRQQLQQQQAASEPTPSVEEGGCSSDLTGPEAPARGPTAAGGEALEGVSLHRPSLSPSKG